MSTDPRALMLDHQDTDPKGQFTYKADGVDIVYDGNRAWGSPHIGKAVRISGNQIVRLAGDGESVDGMLMKVEPDGRCSVRTRGFAFMPAGNAVAITAGSKIVGALGAGGAGDRGYIRNVAAAPATYAAATADEIARGRHRVTDASTLARVEVELGV